MAILIIGVALFIIRRGFREQQRAEAALEAQNEALRVATEKAQTADRLKSALLGRPSGTHC